MEVVPAEDAIINREGVLSEDEINHLNQNMDSITDSLNNLAQDYRKKASSDGIEFDTSISFEAILLEDSMYMLEPPESFDPDSFSHPEALSLEMKSRMRQNIYQQTKDVPQEKMLQEWWQEDHIDKYTQAFREYWDRDVFNWPETDTNNEEILSQGYEEATSVIEEHDDFAFSQYEVTERD